MLLRDISGSLFIKRYHIRGNAKQRGRYQRDRAIFVIKAAKAIIHCAGKHDQALHFSDNYRPISTVSRSLFLMEIKWVKRKTFERKRWQNYYASFRYMNSAFNSSLWMKMLRKMYSGYIKILTTSQQRYDFSQTVSQIKTNFPISFIWNGDFKRLLNISRHAFALLWYISHRFPEYYYFSPFSLLYVFFLSFRLELLPLLVLLLVMSFFFIFFFLNDNLWFLNYKALHIYKQYILAIQ